MGYCCNGECFESPCGSAQLFVLAEVIILMVYS